MASKLIFINLAVTAVEKWVGELSDGEFLELVRLGG